MRILGISFATRFFDFNIGFFKKKERVGEVVSRLVMSRIFLDRPRWQWKRVRPRGIEIDSSGRLNPHMAIVGESGSGKSNACKAIVRHIASQGINVAILDPHNEYIGIADSINASVYDAAHSGINIFELDGVSEREKANELTNMFRRVFRLGDVQGYQLYRAILFTYTRVGAYGRVPGMRDLMYTMEIFKKHASTGEQRAIEGISRRLSLIDTGSFSTSTTMEKVMSGNSIFMLSGLHTNEAQSVYVEGFLRKVYARMLASEKGGRTRLYIVIDEAEKLGQKSIIGKIAAEGRKYGIGLIVMAQRSKSMDKEIRTNAALFISFYQREPEELNYVANLVSGGNELNRFMEVKKAIRNLRTGSAIVVDSSERNPFITRFGLCRENGTSLAYEIMRLSKECCTMEEMLEKVSQAGFSQSQVSAMAERMEQEGAISSYQLREMSRYDGKWYIAAPRNSPEHDICVSVVKRHIESLGLRCVIYNSSYGPDIIAYYGRERIAVEYETGSKSRESTERMLAFRRKQYSRILMVVNDSKMDQYNALDGVRLARIGDFLNCEDKSVVL